MSDNPKLTMKFLPFAEWRREIAPLWLMDGAERFIPHVLDGYGQLQYMGRERSRSMLYFPITCEYDGERVGWTSIYNMSDEAVRVRGIYVLPEFRSNGIGYHMVKYAASLWPAPWKYCYMYARQQNVERYLRWGFSIPEDHVVRSWDEGYYAGAGRIVLMRKALNEGTA
jgi:GNAT superfamily N-acetyltransferase